MSFVDSTLAGADGGGGVGVGVDVTTAMALSPPLVQGARDRAICIVGHC
ncbi:MAG TPA: hypothetical protein VGF99_21025 [Myxococcota bacterium]